LYEVPWCVRELTRKTHGRGPWTQPPFPAYLAGIRERGKPSDRNSQGHFISLSPLAIEPKNRLKSSPDAAACRSPFATAPLYSFGEFWNLLTAALLDRLTHKAFIIACNLESYRLRESLRIKDKSLPPTAENQGTRS